MNNYEQCIVQSIYHNDILIECNDKMMRKKLKSIGATAELCSWKRLHIYFAAESDLVEKIYQLTALDVLFAGEAHGWPPAAVIQELQEQGKFKGKFKEVVFWLNKDRLIYLVQEDGKRLLIA